MDSLVNIISYNLHGLNQGKSLLFDLCNTGANILFIQEHWQTPINMSKILNFSPKFAGFGISAMEKTISHSVLRGRPFGGVAILVQNDFLSRLSCIKCTDRYVIITIEKTIFVNVYFPCRSTLDCISITESLLKDIADVLCLYPD